MANFPASPPDVNNIPLGSNYVASSTTRVARGAKEYSDGSFTTAAFAMTLEDGWKNTYSVVYSGLAGVAGDLFVLNWVSKIIRLVRIEISGIATTAATFTAQLIKRSAADTGGTTVTAATIVPHDSANALVTATVAAYSAAPTAGTIVGPMRSDKLYLPLTANLSEKLIWDFSMGSGQQPTLRAAGLLAVNLSAAPVGGSIEISTTWTEE